MKDIKSLAYIPPHGFAVIENPMLAGSDTYTFSMGETIYVANMYKFLFHFGRIKNETLEATVSQCVQFALNKIYNKIDRQ